MPPIFFKYPDFLLELIQRRHTVLLLDNQLQILNFPSQSLPAGHGDGGAVLLYFFPMNLFQ
jgi:hypothetical protein